MSLLLPVNTIDSLALKEAGESVPGPCNSLASSGPAMDLEP